MEILSKQSRGQLLIEVLVAIGVVVLVLVGVSSLTSSSIKTTRINTERADAMKIAQGQLLTLEKNNSTFDCVGSTCALDCPNPLPSPTAGVVYRCEAEVVKSDSSYTLKVTIKWPGDNTFVLTKKYVR